MINKRGKFLFPHINQIWWTMYQLINPELGDANGYIMRSAVAGPADVGQGTTLGAWRNVWTWSDSRWWRESTARY